MLDFCCVGFRRYHYIGEKPEKDLFDVIFSNYWVY